MRQSGNVHGPMAHAGLVCGFAGVDRDFGVHSGPWPLFLIAFFRLRANVGWTHSAVCTALGIAFMLLMAWMLNRDFPPGLLQSYFDLPWPFT